MGSERTLPTLNPIRVGPDASRPWPSGQTPGLLTEALRAYCRNRQQKYPWTSKESLLSVATLSLIPYFCRHTLGTTRDARTSSDQDIFRNYF